MLAFGAAFGNAVMAPFGIVGAVGRNLGQLAIELRQQRGSTSLSPQSAVVISMPMTSFCVSSTAKWILRQVRRLPTPCWRTFHSPLAKDLQAGRVDNDMDRPLARATGNLHRKAAPPGATCGCDRAPADRAH